MAHRQQAVGKSNEWYTPPHIFKALGCTFDMDVAYPLTTSLPWIPARVVLMQRSLEETWTGFIWMNPPFGGRGDKALWLEKFFAHDNGIALVPDRTSAPWWQQYAPRADLVLFVAPKIRFLGPRSGNSPAQGTCLLGLGERAWKALYNARNNGLGQLMEPRR